MRLVCPNCGAQYEVPDDVIPTTGRDVQCSNCGHTWFENPGASAEAEAEIESVTYSPDEETPAAAEEAPAPWAKDPDNTRLFDHLTDDEQNSVPAPSPSSDILAEDEVEDEPIASAPTPKAERRQLDPGIAEILREEAEREARKREAEARSSIESQPDLGLDASEPLDQAAESRRRMARLTGEEDAPEPAPLAQPPMADDRPRRERLPDIEEINSTLVASEERNAPTLQEIAKAKSRQRRGFRRGFSWSLVLAMVAVVVYLYAPALSASFPAAEPLLTSYVDMVNDWRIGLDVWMQEAAARMNGSGA